MPIGYRIDRELGIVVTTWAGKITAATAETHYQAMLRDEEALSCGKSLADLREANLELTGFEFKEVITKTVLPNLGSRRWVSAILVQKPYQFGVARQYDAFASTYSFNSIFYDYDEALNWLSNA